MYEILIDKVIGSDFWEDNSVISANGIRSALKGFPKGESELRIVIDSPGGDVFEGITIFNLIRDFARENPRVKITSYILGMAASMASIVALAAKDGCADNRVVANDNSVFMIHDAWGYCCGNENDFRDYSEFLGKVDDVLLGVYERISGLAKACIRKAMDEETWYFGNEIKEAGFVDEVLQGEKKADGSENLVSAKSRFGAAKALLTKSNEADVRDYRAAALVLGLTEALPSENNGGCMDITVEKLKSENPDVFNAILEEGKKIGRGEAEARASRLLQLGEKTGAVATAVQCFRDGKDTNDPAVIDLLFEKGAQGKIAASQRADGVVGDVNPPKNDVNGDSEELQNSFARAMGRA